MIIYEEESYPIYSTPSKQCYDKHTLLEFTWNGPGMTWNRAKKTSLFFTWISPGMTWNDLEWQII